MPYGAFTLPTDTRGEAFFALPLPGDPLLEGLDFFAQAFVVDPNGASAQSLSFTARLRARLHSS